eukprot:TRINITY_DN3017_c0_g1_i1.p1 TRINITY_DN3017_c0_g1~~TRINITY_DN3017_c0_g1_i1.p1  ORF type:complete len:185 (+),score=9.19 TRINITY_DN3017_c0_g1_i1:74-556(+)
MAEEVDDFGLPVSRSPIGQGGYGTGQPADFNSAPVTESMPGPARIASPSSPTSDAFEARVEKPETVGSAVQKYTTYLVNGKLHDGATFSSRKRYSDFEWLRKAMGEQFPGICIPPLPKKQKLGRFEDTHSSRGLPGMPRQGLRPRLRWSACPGIFETGFG